MSELSLSQEFSYTFYKSIIDKADEAELRDIAKKLLLQGYHTNNVVRNMARGESNSMVLANLSTAYQLLVEIINSIPEVDEITQHKIEQVSAILSTIPSHIAE